MGDRMKRFIEGEDRKQVTLLPECLDDFVVEDNPVRIIEAFVEELDLGSLGFDGAKPSGNWRRRFRDGIARTMPSSISRRCPALGRSRQLMSKAVDYRSPVLSSGRAAEDLYLRLPEPGPVEPPLGT
jgi:hypothetical protein